MELHKLKIIVNHRLLSLRSNWKAHALQMKVAYNWIKQFLKIDLNYKDVSKMLTELGLEVEGVSQFESVKGNLEGVFVG